MATVDARAMKTDSEVPERVFHGRLKVDTCFCPPAVGEGAVADPFDTVNWEIRTSQIKGENGEVLFEQNNCEVLRSGANWLRTSSAANTSTAKSARLSVSLVCASWSTG